MYQSEPDKVESSNSKIKAAHAGASTRKTRRLQPTASNAADAKAGPFERESRGKSPLCFAKHHF
jgi:hypothetical protein